MQSQYTRKPSVKQRFWAKVHKTDTCWLWQACRTNRGYGNFWNGISYVPAHRFSYELVNGPIPDGLLVCHHCDVRNCVRPEHLFLGTYLDNSRDMYAKGRAPVGATHGRYTKPEKTPRGERNGTAKMVDADVNPICEAYAAGEKVTAIARRYGVSHAAICRLLDGQTWRHVERTILLRR